MTAMIGQARSRGVHGAMFYALPRSTGRHPRCQILLQKSPYNISKRHIFTVQELLFSCDWFKFISCDWFKRCKMNALHTIVVWSSERIRIARILVMIIMKDPRKDIWIVPGISHEQIVFVQCYFSKKRLHLRNNIKCNWPCTMHLTGTCILKVYLLRFKLSKRNFERPNRCELGSDTSRHIWKCARTLTRDCASTKYSDLLEQMFKYFST